MHFVAHLKVEIAGQIINTVHSVKTKFDSKHIGSSCDIVVPLNSVISYDDPRNTYLPAIKINPLIAFKVGDPVTVTAWYDGYPQLVRFQGFVFEFKEGMPCTIKCIDYLPLLGHMQNLHFKSVTLKNLITQILKGTNITLQLPTLDLTLVDLTFRTVSPWGILMYVKKGLGINISLQGNTLYCNVASNTLDEVDFSTGRNIHETGLQQPDTVWQGYKVKAWFVKENGVRDSLEVGDTEGHVTDVYFYRVQADINTYTRLANEALIKIRQRKFSGKIKGYLYPDVKLFDRLSYTDLTYPDKNGNYVLTAYEETFSDEGFHKEMTIAFLVDNLNAA